MREARVGRFTAPFPSDAATGRHRHSAIVVAWSPSDAHTNFVRAFDAFSPLGEQGAPGNLTDVADTQDPPKPEQPGLGSTVPSGASTTDPVRRQKDEEHASAKLSEPCVRTRETLLRQFFVTLRATHTRVIHGPRAKQFPQIVARIELLLRAEAWCNAYEIEHLFIQLFDDADLKVALDGRCLEAEGVLSKEAYDLCRAKRDAAKTPDEQRALLSWLLDDLQWKYTKSEVRAELDRRATWQTNLLFIVLMIVIAACLLSRELGGPNASDLVFAMIAGAWGASFSMITSLRERLEHSTFDALKSMAHWVFTLSRVVIGLGAGAALYMLLVSGLVAGNGFPDVSAARFDPATTRPKVAKYVGESLARRNYKDVNAQRVADFADEVVTCDPSFDRLRLACSKFVRDIMPKEASDDARLALEACLHADLERHFADLGVGKRLLNKDLLLLIVWCLIAGFSERFVPNLLAKNEQKASGATSA